MCVLERERGGGKELVVPSSFKLSSPIREDEVTEWDTGHTEPLALRILFHPISLYTDRSISGK